MTELACHLAIAKLAKIGDLDLITLADCVECKDLLAAGKLAHCNPLEKAMFISQPDATCYRCELTLSQTSIIGESQCDLTSANVLTQEVLSNLMRLFFFIIGFSMLRNKNLKNHPYGIWGCFFYIWSGYYHNSACMDFYQLIVGMWI